MRVNIGDKNIVLVKRDVRLAKRLIRRFLDSVKTKSAAQGATSFYYTFVVVMYVISADLIHSLTPEALALILNAHAKNKEDTTT